MLPMSVAQSSDMFTIGRIAYLREGVDNAYISRTTRAIFTKFLCMLPVSMSSSDRPVGVTVAYVRAAHTGIVTG